MNYGRCIEPQDWIALAGVLAAFFTGFTATYFAYRESVEARHERQLERIEERRSLGRREALATLTPLFAFVSDLEKVALAADRDPSGFARYTQSKIFGAWEQTVRPIMLGLTAASASPQVRAEAQRVVGVVDRSIVGHSFELEMADDLDSFSEEETLDIAQELVSAVAQLREGAERIASALRDGS